MSIATQNRPQLSNRKQSNTPRLKQLPQPKSRVAPLTNVEFCYTLIHAGEAIGILDLADGEYVSTDSTLEEGIERQLNLLLDQVGCDRPGFRLLEIGCGYGHLQRLAKQRGAQVVGINVSKEQVQHCNAHGAQVYHGNYRDLLEANEWHGQFDGVISNGSLEHWVQPADVLAGRMHSIYNESFDIVHRLLDPAREDARYVTTAIHVKSELQAKQLLTPWYRHRRGSDLRHFSLLHQWMGGYYPVPGLLERCARPYFALEAETDGTIGYKIANDYRMTRIRRGLYTNSTLLWRLARAFARHPFVTSTMLECFLIEQSWDWQFQSDDPPTRLLRQTWCRNTLPRWD